MDEIIILNVIERFDGINPFHVIMNVIKADCETHFSKAIVHVFSHLNCSDALSVI
jgi:hypothetical protein